MEGGGDPRDQHVCREIRLFLDELFGKFGPFLDLEGNNLLHGDELPFPEVRKYL